jgi:carboxyl-terminal processing protease
MTRRVNESNAVLPSSFAQFAVLRRLMAPRWRFAATLRSRRALALTVALCASASFARSSARAEPQANSPYQKLAIFARALAHVEQSYVSDVDPDRLIYGAIRGMLGALDPHSSFMDPEQFRILSDDAEGRYGGVGIEIDARDGWLTVVSVFPAGPAARAGVKPGDRFLAIAGIAARDLPIEQAQERMRGEPGTQVAVVLRRPDVDEAIALTLTREVIEVRAVDARVLPDGIVYVHLKVFQETTASELHHAIDEAVERSAARGGAVTGVMLDLRDNPGGLLSSAVAVADQFLRQGVIVSTRGRGGQLMREQRASAIGTWPDWPIVVLINGYTASAAEIVAGALRDQKRATTLGTRSFGKGSVQNVIELPDQSAMKLTTALYYTPNGHSIQAEGIEPDVAVEQLDPETLQKARLARSEVSEAALAQHIAAQDLPPPATATDRASAHGPAPAGGIGASDPFADDYQARMGHQVLTALIAAARAARH